MGGHGALTIALKNPKALPIGFRFRANCAPCTVLGTKAFRHYLGEDRDTWKSYDTTELVQITDERLPVLVDQGDADNFLNEQLQTDRLITASATANYQWPFACSLDTTTATFYRLLYWRTYCIPPRTPRLRPHSAWLFVRVDRPNHNKSVRVQPYFLVYCLKRKSNFLSLSITTTANSCDFPWLSNRCKIL